MQFKIIIIFTLLLACFVGGYVVFQKTKLINSDANNNRFVVGMTAGYAPFVSINEKGEYEGFDIDVARELAQQLNKELIFKDLGSMTSLFTALDQGSIDAIIWGISITQDRIKKVAMINYQGDTTSSYPLIFWQAIPTGVQTISDMNGKTICVEPASSQDAVLSKYTLINKLLTEKVDDALLNIQYGKTDAAFVEPAIAKKFKNKYPEIQILDVQLKPEDQVQGVGIVIKQNNSKLIKQVQAAVETLKSRDVIKQLEKKWDMAS